MIQNIGILVRVSTKDKGQETDRQILATRNLIKNKGWEKDKLRIWKLEESAYKGDRKEFNEALEEMKKEKINILIVDSIDRLGRQGIYKTLDIINNLTTHNIKLVSVKEPIIDTSNKIIGDIMISLLSAFAQQESESISHRVKSGMREKAQEKQRIMNRPPTGYKMKTRKDNLTQKVIHNELVIEETEATKIRIIYEMKIQGHTLGNIHQETGISINTIKNILKNKAYTGNLEYKTTTIKIPAIISQEQYDKAQETN